MPRPSNQGVHRQGRHDENAVHAYDLWLGGMTYAEIGRETNCDRKVARDRVLRAVALLRGEVEDKRDRIGNEHLKDMTALEVIATSNEVETKDRIVVGVNEYVQDAVEVPIQIIDPAVEELQARRLAQVKRERDPQRAEQALAALRDTAVTWLARAGCTVPEIRSITGHDPRTIYSILKHYLAIDREQASAAIGKLVLYLESEGAAL